MLVGSVDNMTSGKDVSKVVSLGWIVGSDGGYKAVYAKPCLEIVKRTKRNKKSRREGQFIGLHQLTQAEFSEEQATYYTAIRIHTKFHIVRPLRWRNLEQMP